MNRQRESAGDDGLIKSTEPSCPFSPAPAGGPRRCGRGGSLSQAAHQVVRPLPPPPEPEPLPDEPPELLDPPEVLPGVGERWPLNMPPGDPPEPDGGGDVGRLPLDPLPLPILLKIPPGVPEPDDDRGGGALEVFRTLPPSSSTSSYLGSSGS